MSSGPPWSFTPRDVLEPVKSSIRRVAALPAPLANPRTPMFAAVLPMEIGDGPWLGNYIWDVLRENGATLENYITRQPALFALEYVINLRIHQAANAGGPWRYAPRPHDMEVALRIRKRVPKGAALGPDDVEALMREKKVALTVILYY